MVNTIHKNQKDISIAVTQILNNDDTDLGIFAGSVGTDIHNIVLCVRTVAKLIDTLHGIGLCHGDLSTRHVIVTRHNQASCDLRCIYRLK